MRISEACRDGVQCGRENRVHKYLGKASMLSRAKITPNQSLVLINIDLHFEGL